MGLTVIQQKNNTYYGFHGKWKKASIAVPGQLINSYCCLFILNVTSPQSLGKWGKLKEYILYLTVLFLGDYKSCSEWEWWEVETLFDFSEASAVLTLYGVGFFLWLAAVKVWSESISWYIWVIYVYMAGKGLWNSPPGRCWTLEI